LSSKGRFALLFALAALNDAVDLLGLVSPIVEVILDVFTAVLVTAALGELNPLLFLVALLDVIPGIDYTPFWTFYILYKYLVWGRPRRVRVDVS